MKVLFTQDALVNAGAERSHLEILSRISKDVDVGFVYFYPKHDLREAYERAGIRLFFLDIPEKYHLLQGIWKLIKFIKKENPDILISSLWRADIITRLASVVTGVPLIGTLVNDSYSPIAWTDKKGMKYKIVYWLDRLTAGIPIHWIANAQALADSHIRTLGLSPERISVVYRGRPIPLLPPRSVPASPVGGSSHSVTSSPRSVSSQTEIPKTEISIKHFISYGRLLERKGFQDAIHAFSQVLKTYPDSTLTIFGEGPFRSKLEALIFELNLQSRVYLPGKFFTDHSQSSDSPSRGLGGTTSYELLQSAHCFLFPSWYEGFSGALVEAMMAGIPIIASDISMNLEAVTDQQTALVFQVGNSEDLAEKMKFAMQKPELMASLGQSARREAEERFDIEKIAREYEGLVRRITPPRPSPGGEGEHSKMKMGK